MPAPRPDRAKKGEGPLISVTGLDYRIGARSVLRIPSWEVEPGEHGLILGPSGSGKTTLLHLLAGLLTAPAGAVRVQGIDLNALRSAERDGFRGRNIGLVFQKLHLVSALTLTANLALAQYLAGLPVARQRIHELLERVHLGHRAKAMPADLSQGEAQRVAIVRALINEPALVLADEPTAALDDGNCGQVMDLLFEHAQSAGATLVVATHDHRIRDRFRHRLSLEVDG